MPWRKYKPRTGKFGPIYKIARGVQVRMDARKKWALFIDINGQRKNKTIGEGRPALVKAVKAAESVAAKLGNLKATQPVESNEVGVPKFKDFSRSWLESNARRWDDDTFIRYEAILRLHVWPYPCYKRPLDAIGRKDIKMHLRQVAKKRSPSTVEAVHAVVSGIFNEAIDDEIVGANPSAGLLKKILPPKNRRYLKDADPFRREERDRFLAKAEVICSWTEVLLLKMMVFAGLRLGEAIAMRAEHLDLAKRTYYVAQSYKTRIFKRPKFGKARLVDLPVFLIDELSEYLVELKKRNLKAGRGGQVDLLFEDPSEINHWPYSQRKIQGLMKKICKAAGLRTRNPHDLRHTYATILLMAHESPGYVQKQLGHSSISITMDVYCHWIPGEGRRNLERALLGDAVVPNRVRKPHIFAYIKKRLQ